MKFLVEKGEQGNRARQMTQQQHIFFNIEHPSKRTQCDLCRKNISNHPRIVVGSEDTWLDYCVACFSNLHLTPDSYHVCNKLNYPLFEPSWSAHEELLMLEGIQTFGFGNWNGVADLLTTKTKEEVEEHYQRIYLSQPQFIPNVPVLTIRNDQGLLEGPQKDQTRRHPKPHTTIQVKEQKVVSQTGQPPSPSEVVGFMPRRGDFEVEYDNDAELLLAEMEFNEDDSEEEKALKFRLIDIYNQKLMQRNKRKDFVIERKLLDIKEQMRLDKTRTKEEKEIYNLMKVRKKQGISCKSQVLARFSKPDEHERLVQGIIREKQLRQRIAQLKEMQSKGIKTLGQVEEELQSKRKKEDRNKRREDFTSDKGKTRRVGRKDNISEKTEKKVLLVSKEEDQLCRSLNMTYRQYSSIKETILREAVRMGIVNRDKTTEELMVGKRIGEIVFDFVVEQEQLVQGTPIKAEQ